MKTRGRRQQQLSRRPRFLLVVEGQVTERDYFQALASRHRLKIELKVHPKSGTPKTLVEVAADEIKRAKKEHRRTGDPSVLFDHVWCVYDVDDHPNLAQARDQASANQIELAISNPCFELWVLLHFQQQTAALSRVDLRRVLTNKYLPEYRKALPLSVLEPLYDQALSNARALDRYCGLHACHGSNPSTRVHVLTELIRTVSSEQP